MYAPGMLACREGNERHSDEAASRSLLYLCKILVKLRSLWYSKGIKDGSNAQNNRQEVSPT